jgi:hypothetical protein
MTKCRSEVADDGQGRLADEECVENHSNEEEVVVASADL